MIEDVLALIDNALRILRKPLLPFARNAWQVPRQWAKLVVLFGSKCFCPGLVCIPPLPNIREK